MWRSARALAAELQGDLTFPVFKAAAALAVLVDHFESHGLAPRTLAFIGCGSGFFGTLALRVIPDSRAYFIDFPKMLLFQARSIERALPGAAMRFRGSDSDPRVTATFVPSWEAESIDDRIDCAVNMASMQEMNVHSIGAHFDFLRRRSGPQSRFYCVNRECKKMLGGEVAAFSEYPWHPDDEIFIDTVCPYYTH